MNENKGWLQRLRQKWKLKSIVQVVLVLCTFAIGGSLCGFLGKKIMSLTAIESDLLWGTLYVILVTLLWPICVILVSIPFGQFSFFKSYIKQMGKRLLGKKQK